MRDRALPGKRRTAIILFLNARNLVTYQTIPPGPLDISFLMSMKEERDQYRTASETFARAIHVLTIENDNLRRDIEKRRSSSVTSLPSRR